MLIFVLLLAEFKVVGLLLPLLLFYNNLAPLESLLLILLILLWLCPAKYENTDLPIPIIFLTCDPFNNNLCSYTYLLNRARPYSYL